MNPGAPIPVVAALIERDGRVLVAQRPAHKHMGLKWEFPGGKVEPGESPRAALSREIREELGVEVIVGEALPEFDHDYGTTCIRMISFRCTLAPSQHEPAPHEHVGIRWVSRVEIRGMDLAAADWPVVESWMRAPESRAGAPL